MNSISLSRKTPWVNLYEWLNWKQKNNTRILSTGLGLSLLEETNNQAENLISSNKNSSGLSSKKAEQTEEKSTEQLAEIAKNQALMVMCLQWI